MMIDLYLGTEISDLLVEFLDLERITYQVEEDAFNVRE